MAYRTEGQEKKIHHIEHKKNDSNSPKKSRELHKVPSNRLEQLNEGVERDSRKERSKR